MKVEKQVIDLMDKLTVRYIFHLAQTSSDVCNGSGKKTLSMDHIIEALKKLGLDTHIKQIVQLELKLDKCNDTEINEDDVDEMKDRLNKKKRKKDKKNEIVMTEDLKAEQMRLFEESRLEAMRIIESEQIQTEMNSNKKKINEMLIRPLEIQEEENFD